MRLKLVLGGHASLADASPPPRWTQLWDLATTGRVALVGASAVGVWVPGVVADEVTVAVTSERTAGVPAPLDGVRDVRLVPASAATAASVPIAFQGRRILVASPGELALDPVCVTWRTPLAVAARLLHEDRVRDTGDRRAPAHRDPQHLAERQRNLETSRFRRMPPPRDDRVRSWRLGSPVGYEQWLRSTGYPLDW